jgi:hypothetical protein
MAESDPANQSTEAALAKKERIRVIDEEIGRLLEEARRSHAEASVYLNELRAAEGLPPYEGRDSRV